MKFIYTFIVFSFFSVFLNGQDSLVWEFPTGDRVYSSPAIDDSTVYIGSNDNCLYAINKHDGTLKWKFETGGEIKSKPLLYNGSVIFNSTDGFLYALDKESAENQWTFETGGEERQDMWDYYLSSPVISGKKIFVGSGDQNVYAIDPANGNLRWKFKTGDIVHATPVVHDQVVYVGSYDGYFYALSADQGKLIWKFRTVGDAYFPDGAIQKGAVIYRNSVIFGSRDFNIYALHTETGRGMWNRKEAGSWIIATPLLHNDVVYFGTSDSHRFCGLDANRGHEKCSYDLNMRVYGNAVSYDENIYFGCFNGKMYKLDSCNGKLEQIFQTHGSKKNYYTVYNEKGEFRNDFEVYGKDPKASERMILNLGAILSTPVIDEGIMYFGDANGVIYAYRLE